MRRFLSATPAHSSLPMIIELSVAGVISGNRALLSPPRGGSKKRDCFHLQKKPPLPPVPATIPKPGGSEAPFCREVFRGLVESYSSEVYVSGGGGASRQNAKRRGRRWALRRGASAKKCRSHSALPSTTVHAGAAVLGRCATASLSLVPRTYPLSTPPQITHKPSPCAGSQREIFVRVNRQYCFRTNA